MRIAVVSGSFDPITQGHVDLIGTAAALFDEVHVVIVANGEKAHGCFSPMERLQLVEKAVETYENVRAVVHDGLLSAYCQAVGAQYLVRGVRNGTDFAYEYDLAAIMRRFNEGLTTIFLPSLPEHACISSTYVRELLKYGCSLNGAVPEECAEMMRRLYNGH